MRDSREHDYRDAKDDLFECVEKVSDLPWKEVILTGGEPTIFPSLLDRSLLAINPKRPIRIVSNGDWALRDGSRRRILSIIKASGRNVRMDISGHDDPETFERKIESLVGEIPLGIQLREEETEDFATKVAYLMERGLYDVLETHHVLGMGEAREGLDSGRAVRLELGRLYTYSTYRNIGAYIMRGRGGIRLVVNHETPYLVEETPADLAKPGDTPDVILEKLICHYGDNYFYPDIPGRKVQYARAAFRSGVPLNVAGLASYEPEAACSLMGEYYNIVAENSDQDAETLREDLTRALAARIINIYGTGMGVRINPHPIVDTVAVRVPRDSATFIQTVAHCLIITSRPGLETDGGNPISSTNPILRRQLKLLGISGTDLVAHLNSLSGRETDSK
jgi:hypothetical protein